MPLRAHSDARDASGAAPTSCLSRLPSRSRRAHCGCAMSWSINVRRCDRSGPSRAVRCFLNCARTSRAMRRTSRLSLICGSATSRSAIGAPNCTVMSRRLNRIVTNRRKRDVAVQSSDKQHANDRALLVRRATPEHRHRHEADVGFARVAEVALQPQQSLRIRPHQIAADQKAARAIQKEEPMAFRDALIGQRSSRPRQIVRCASRCRASRDRSASGCSARRRRAGAAAAFRCRARSVLSSTTAVRRTMANERAFQAVEHAPAGRVVRVTVCGRRRSCQEAVAVSEWLFWSSELILISQTFSYLRLVASVTSSAVRRPSGAGIPAGSSWCVPSECSETACRAGNVAEQRHLFLGVLDVVFDQSPQHDRLFVFGEHGGL